MQFAHYSSSYRAANSQASQAALELERLVTLHATGPVDPSTHVYGRTGFTRALDLLLGFIRRRLPPLHWIIGRAFALTFFCYAKWVASTITVSISGTSLWEDSSSGVVLVTWHGEAPALLSALIARRASRPILILIATDPRGDYLSILCSWLGFRIVRGDSLHGGWEALAYIAEQVRGGAMALITADGGGPALTAKVGAVALACAAHVPLIPVGANCIPAAVQKHKWDTARNPLPYGRLTVIDGQSISFGAITDATALEAARQQLQDALNQVSKEAYMPNTRCE